MLVAFKSPQIRRLSGIRAFFEVIPEQSKSLLIEKSHLKKYLVGYSSLISPEVVL